MNLEIYHSKPIEYDTFKLIVFEVISSTPTSRSIITKQLKKLSNDFDIPFNKVIEDYNLYDCYTFEIKE